VTETTAIPTPDPEAKRSPAWVWPAIIIGMLAVHTLACLVVVFIATSDPSHAVIPDYHAKAVAWDEHRAKLRASGELGWACTIEAALAADLMGQRAVRVSLRDAAKQPLTGAAVKLTSYHHARANDVNEAEFKEGAPGEYVAMVDMRRDGTWRFDVAVTRGDDSFSAEIDQRVGSRQGGAR
jgi:nitrogen fixation protein FixH